MTTTINTTGSRRCGIILFAATIFFILSIVIIGVCVRFLTEGKVQQIILITLICILAFVGMSCVITLELRRRRSLKKAKNTRVANSNLNTVEYKPAPTAPPMTNPSSWNFSKNYSNRTTIQA